MDARVPQHVHAERHGDLRAELTDDPGHGDGGDRLGLREVRQAELVREHDAVNPASLQIMQFLAGASDHRVKAALRVVAGVTRKSRQVEHRDDGLLHREDVVQPGGHRGSFFLLPDGVVGRGYRGRVRTMATRVL